MRIRSILFFTLLSVELIACVLFCVQGKHGFYASYALQVQEQRLAQEQMKLAETLASCQNECEQWENDPAFREQAIRSRLKMGAADEIWYYY